LGGGGKMTQRSEKPDFIADQFGDVQDVRHLRYSHEICPKCGEEYEEQFDVCWNCGTSRDGRTSPDFEAQKKKAMGVDNEDSESLSSLADAAKGVVFPFLLFLGGVLVIAGIALFIGNRSGAFPTFAYAGCFLQFIGWAIIAVMTVIKQSAE
jgi:ribosomal protein L37E